MVSLSGAEGGRPRLGGQLPVVIFAPIVGVSIRALLLKLPVQSPAVSGLYYYPSSLVLSLVNGSYSGEEPTTIPLLPKLWW